MKNNLVCDITTGICGDPNESTFEMIDLTAPIKKAQLYYFTDPICSHCWALEPVLNRFIEEYGKYFDLKIVMGGLLEKWDGFADKANGIGGPKDVAGHWREVGEYSRMPIDGSLFLSDPIQSSFPPSRVFKVIQQKDERLAVKFLRKAREAVFSFNRNIGERDVLIDIVNQLGINGAEIVDKAYSESGHTLLEEDFAAARAFGVRGFPTIIIVSDEEKGVKIVGSRALEDYVKGLKQVLELEKLNKRQVPSLQELLNKQNILFSKEIEVMYDVEQKDVSSYIQDQLPKDSYVLKEILGEIYVEKL